MAVFKDCFVLLELKTLPFKEKKKLKSAITENGGSITFVVNKQCSLVVTSDVSSLSSNRLRSIQKHQTPVVGVDYVFSSLNAGILLPVDDYKLDVSITEQESHQVSKVPARKAFPEPPNRQLKPKISETPERSGNVLERFRIYTETDSDLPTFPDNFEVAKYSVFQKTNSNTWCVLELQSVKGDNGRQYRVVCYRMNDIEAKKAAVKDKLVFLPTSEDALEVYLALRENLQSTGLQLRSNIPSQAQDLGSGPLQQLLLEEKLNTGSLSQEVGVFVELLWTEALGCLENILQVPIDGLSLNDVSRAEGLLLQAQRKLKEGNHTEAESLLEDVYTLLPHRAPQLPPSAKLISQKLDLCQLIRDVLNVSEMTLRSPAPSSVGKYRALRCSIEAVPSSSSEFQAVTALLQDSKVTIRQVMRVNRGVELQMFKSEVGNIKPLLHSSSPSNFVGILSRGLLLPRVGVELHGIQRTDVGNLGSGIYFSDAMSTSVKYTKPSETDGSRMLLVCDVALGCCRDLHKRDFTLTQAPEGHHSVHGVRCTANVRSEFQDDEYVVYSPDQIKLKYVVQFSVDGDQLKEFSPAISTSAEVCLPSTDQELSAEDDGIESIKNPLEDVTAGLLDSSGQQLPLQAVHVKCKLMDLLSQVIIFQKYTNTSSVPIEAKYVFPLDDSAAVCGFEAFINGKHVVGQVKEKETARKEYKQAIERGHGAYLMDQDAPDVFTISVGNLPPGATVLIKVTFVSELIVRDGSVFFSLPGSVAPWQESAALNQTTQVTLEKVCVTDEASSTREFTLDMSVEMPYEISRLQCITHQVKTKRTDCKAVVSVLPGQVMGSEGFQLSITLSDVHLPRMWVEKHPDKDSQACMLVFYPDFDISSSSASDEVILLLDTSESMRGESLCTAQRIALQILKTLDHNLKINVILFGTDHKEAFITAQPRVEAYHDAEQFLKCFTPVGGSTELWRPLQALNLLPPTRGIRNILLLSDGHIQNAELTLKLLRENAQHSRLFTCGLSPTANRHMLRALAQAGGGAYEFFDTKTKHNWQEKVACQVKRMASPGCNSVSVKWQQFSLSAPTPVQAPKQIHALFSDCHTLVYGFVPHCTRATLLGNLSGQELKTMVSTSELQKTRGTFLHKLTARALIRDFEDGNLHTDEAEHEGKKAELKSYIIELSKEFSILSQFTSFVAIEERDSEQTEKGFTDVPKLIAEEDVDILPYISWTSQEESDDYYEDDEDNYVEVDYCYEKCKMMDMNLNYEDEAYDDISYDGDLYGNAMIESAMLCDADEEEDASRDFMPPPKIAYCPTSPSVPQLQSLTILSAPPPPCPPPPPPALPILYSFSSARSSSVPPCPVSPLPPPYLPTGLICQTPPLPMAFFEPEAVIDLCDTLPVESELHWRPKSKRKEKKFASPAVDRLSKPQAIVRMQLQQAPMSAMSSKIQMHSFAADSLEKERSPTHSIGLMGSAPNAAPGPVDLSLHCADSLTVKSSPASVPFGSSAFGFGGPIGSMASFSSYTDTNKSHTFVGLSTVDSYTPQSLVQTSSFGISQECPPQGGSLFGLGLDPAKRSRFCAKSLRRRAYPVICSTADTENALKLKWTKIFQMQHTEGYWELTTELGELINVDVDTFTNVFLKSRGINSLGVRAHTDILRLVATLLVLQLMRVEKLKAGKLLRTLFSLDEAQPRPEWWEEVKRAVDWVCWADRQYPCAYSRLEFGLSWESSTRQLLGHERLPPFSPLSGLKLQKTPVPLISC